MKKISKIITGILGMAFLHVTAAYAAEISTIGNLTETSGKISSIDMNKSFGEAGQVFNAFYSASNAKSDSSSQPVYLEVTRQQRTLAQAEKELCSAKPLRINPLASKVPQVALETDKTSQEEKDLPRNAGALALGAISLLIAAAGRKKSYADDVNTVWDAIQHPIDTYNDIHNYDENMHNYETQSGHSTAVPNSHGSNYEVEQDAATTLHCDPTGTCTQ